MKMEDLEEGNESENSTDFEEGGDEEEEEDQSEEHEQVDESASVTEIGSSSRGSLLEEWQDGEEIDVEAQTPGSRGTLRESFSSDAEGKPQMMQFTAGSSSSKVPIAAEMELSKEMSQDSLNPKISEESATAATSTWYTFFSRMWPSKKKRKPRSDLDMEQLEQFRMITGMSKSEIISLRRSFLTYAEDLDNISREEFLAIPSVTMNPLRDRLLMLFGLQYEGGKPRISFRDFMEVMAVLNSPSALVDQKLRAAFQLQDMDDDGKISHSDLVRYLELVSKKPGEGQEFTLSDVADRVLEEGSSDPGQAFLSFADFSRIVLMVNDFGIRLRLNI
jgi:Ca2+-binding EF-hand superfamily protein